TGTFTAAGKVYDGNTNATVTGRNVAGAVQGDTVSLTGDSAKFDSRNVGDRTVTLTDGALAGNDKDNYTLASVATASAKITPLGVTGKFASADKVYDGTLAAAATGRALVGAVQGDTVSLSSGTATFDSRNVGDRAVTLTGATLAGADKDNYTLSSAATAPAKITPLGITGKFTAA